MLKIHEAEREQNPQPGERVVYRLLFGYDKKTGAPIYDVLLSRKCHGDPVKKQLVPPFPWDKN